MDKTRHKSDWQRVSILTLSTTGRVRTIEMSIWRVYLLASFLVIVFGLVLAVLFIKVSNIADQRNDLVRRNAELRESLEEMRAAIEPLSSYQERIRSLIGADVDSTVMATAESQGVMAAAPDRSAEAVGHPLAQTSTKVEVESLRTRWRRVSRGHWSLTFSFNLTNKSEGGARASGMVAVVAKSTRKGSATAGSYPAMELDNDFPVDPLKGDSFSIARLKPIRGEIDVPTGGEPFDQLLVYVFLSDGRLFYRVTMPIEAPSD